MRNLSLCALLCESGSLYIKNKDRCLHALPPCQSHDCGFPAPTRSRVPLNWAGDSGGGEVVVGGGGWGVFTYYQRRRKQGSGRKGGIKERWRKERLGWCISDDRATSSRRWPVQETAHFYSDGGELGGGGGMGGWGGSSLHWAPDWLHHLFVQTAEQTSTDKHRLALAASRHLVLIWGYGTLVVCARLPLFDNTTYLLSAPPLMIMWMRG